MSSRNSARRGLATSPLLLAALFAASDPRAQSSFSVGPGGTHSSIQAAVDACPAEGCAITLVDSVYDLPREIWIEGKSNLSIQASVSLRAAGVKPRLHTDANLLQLAGTAADPDDPARPAEWRRWPTTCGTGNGGSQDSANPYSADGHQSNGLVVVRNSRDILISGIRIDGGAPSIFVNKGVWACKYDLLHGNVGVNIMESGRVTLRGNDIHGFFAGIHIRGRNPGGAYASGPLAGSTAGSTGDHLVDGNRIHDNWWAVYDESEWDLGSTFRGNLAWANENTAYALTNALTSEGSNMAGGFLYLKDVPQTTHRFVGNTISGAPMVLGHGYYNYATQHLFYDNIVAGFSRISDPALRALVGDGRQLLGKYDRWIEDNLFEIEDSSRFLVQSMHSAQTTDSSICAEASQTAPCWINFDDPIPVTSDVMWPWNGWTVEAVQVPFPASFKAVDFLADLRSIETLPHGGLVTGMYGAGASRTDVTAADNRWVRHIPWKSLDPVAPSFLVPEWSDSFARAFYLGQGRAASGWATSDSAPEADVGAISRTFALSAPWGIHSQEPIAGSGGNCWSIPTRRGSGVLHDDVRVHRVQAWSVPVRGIPASSTELTVEPLADSTYHEAGTLSVCLSRAVSTDSTNLRFQVEWSGVNSATSRRELSEPAYFVRSFAGGSNPIGVSAHGRSAGPLKLLSAPTSLRIAGLAEGTAHIELRTLDGRILFRGELPCPAGVATIPTGTRSARPVVVQVRQGGSTAQALAPSL